MKHLIFILGIFFMLGCSEKDPVPVELVIDSKSTLGEGAIWDYKTNRLMWVDIKKKILNIYNPATANNREMFTGQMIGTVVPTESGNALVALERGIYFLIPKNGSKRLLITPKNHVSDLRFNDGKCDPSGRFWVGTKSISGAEKASALFRLDPDTTLHKMIENVSISNGIVWTADKTKMYYIDTSTRKVMGYEYKDETGEISNPEVAVEIPEGMGWPDGMAIDKNDNLWIALWGGSAVACFNPKTGELIRKIEVPAKNVTSCAFGDEDLKTLYITTAREDTSEEELVKWPWAGGVFKIRTGVTGVKAFYFNDENNSDL